MGGVPGGAGNRTKEPLMPAPKPRSRRWLSDLAARYRSAGGIRPFHRDAPSTKRSARMVRVTIETASRILARSSATDRFGAGATDLDRVGCATSEAVRFSILFLFVSAPMGGPSPGAPARRGARNARVGSGHPRRMGRGRGCAHGDPDSRGFEHPGELAFTAGAGWLYFSCPYGTTGMDCPDANAIWLPIGLAWSFRLHRTFFDFLEPGVGRSWIFPRSVPRREHLHTL